MKFLRNPDKRLFYNNGGGLRKGKFNVSISRKTGSYAWHTGALNWYPEKVAMWDDLESMAREHLFPQKTLLFGKDDKILTMGSCFARNLRAYLKDNGKSSETINIPSGLNNSFAIRQYIEWAITGKRSEDAYWYDVAEEVWESPQEQYEVLEEIKETAGFVCTFGLAEVWKDKLTNGVFWRGVPKGKFDSEIHECVTSSVSENLQNMNRIYELIQSTGPKQVFYTLSPVPLNATFMDRPAIVSDCVSKSILRVALDEFFKQGLPNVHYWPSFEMIKSGVHSAVRTMGVDKDARSPNDEIVGIIIKIFIETYFE